MRKAIVCGVISVLILSFALPIGLNHVEAEEAPPTRFHPFVLDPDLPLHEREKPSYYLPSDIGNHPYLPKGGVG